MLSLENCTREVAYLSLLHWDEPSSLVFHLDLEGKALAAGSSLSLSSLLPILDPPLSPGGKPQVFFLLSCLVLGHHLVLGRSSSSFPCLVRLVHPLSYRTEVQTFCLFASSATPTPIHSITTVLGTWVSYW